MTESGSLDWRAILAACVVNLVCGALAGLAWGMLGLMLLIASGPDSLHAVLDGPHVLLAGCMLSLVGEVAGGVYLARTVRCRLLLHCLLFGIGSLIISRSIGIVSGEFFVSWEQSLHYLAVIPAALLGGILGNDL